MRRCTAATRLGFWVTLPELGSDLAALGASQRKGAGPSWRVPLRQGGRGRKLYQICPPAPFRRHPRGW